MRSLLPWLEPTRYDETLKKFPNYFELRSRCAVADTTEAMRPRFRSFGR
jgi:hypothetical protein